MWSGTTGTVTGWGYRNFGHLDFPPGLTNVVSVKAGYAHALALRDNGRVVAWGNNGQNQATVPAGLSNVVMIAAGNAHNLALKANGTVVGWGFDLSSYGTAPPGLNGVAAISAGSYFNVVLKSNRSVVAWGQNAYGETDVPAGLQAVAIAAGSYHVVALKPNVTVVCWGSNNYGQTNVPAGLSNVTMIAAGYYKSMAVTSNGKFWEWGNLELGPPPTNSWNGILRLSPGESHTVALKDNHQLTGWGSTYYGELSPPANLTNILAVSAGYHLTLAVVRGPVFRTQPEGATVLAGTNFTLSAVAEAASKFRYRWYFNGSLLPAATNSSLSFSAIHPTNAGSYTVTISNQYGYQSSTSCVVSVSPSLILTPPDSQVTPATWNASFTVAAKSMVSPLSYRWFFNQTNEIPSATNSTLVISNLQYANQGNYTVCVSNLYGTACSSPAKLTVNPAWSVDDASLVKTYGQTNPMRFNVRLVGARPDTITVDYFCSLKTAVSGVDFIPVAGTLTFPPGTTNLPVDVPIIGSTNLSPTSFLFTLYHSSRRDGYVHLPATGWILNSAYTPTLTLNSTTFPEADTPHLVKVELVLSGPSDRTTSIDFSSIDGSARNGIDFAFAPATIQFPPVTTTQYVSLNILGNLVKQADRAFFLKLSQPTNVTLTTTQVLETIFDDDTLELPNDFGATLVATNIALPTAMEFAPDGRLFVCEQEGSVRIIKDGVMLSQPFLQLATDTYDYSESGLLGLAFDPGFITNHFVYIYYTVPHPDFHNRVSRFTAAGDSVIPGSEQVILDLNRLNGGIHNGGALHFGPDGKLYIGVGENGTGSNAQSLTNLLGKILRINPDGSIPSDNPFYKTASGVNRAIWALGLRNPFSFAFHSQTGRLLINDVGDQTWEEINQGERGANYGWNFVEGPSLNSAYRQPISFYGHTDGCAIIGAAFYNSAARTFPPEYANSYFFADFCSGWIRRLTQNDTPTNFVAGVGNPVDLKVGPEGDLYCLCSKNRFLGRIIRIRYDSAPYFEWIRRLDDGRIQLRANGTPNKPYILETSHDLANWNPVSTNSFSSIEFDFYTAPTNSGPRYFRLTRE